MNRRTGAGLLALALIAAFVAYGASKPVDFVTFRPGPTVNVLGKLEGKDIIQISGRKVYRDSGGLRMVTVYQSRPEAKVDLVEMLWGWINPDIAVLPRSAVFPEETTDAQQKQESAAQMSSSQDNATAAALSAAGIDFRTRILVSEVATDGPSAGKLAKGDVIVAVDGKPVTDTTALVAGIRSRAPGSEIGFTVRRNGAERTVAVRTIAADDDPEASRVGISIGLDYLFPFTVKINISESIGGPSAGMMFALSIYDVLTPGSVTGGKVIAGSGEITPEGVVGPIGGIGQKIAGAQRDGARLFLVAEENCAEAARAHYDKDKIRLVKVHTLAEAIEDVEAWSKDSDAKLPGCA